MSKDQLDRARRVDVLDYVLRYEPDRVKRVGSAYRMKDHPSLEIKSGRWRWYSQGLYGKTALDYLTDVRGYGLVDAVCHLLGEQPQIKDHRNKPKISAPARTIAMGASPPERPSFAIPRHNKDNNRVIAYLQSRGIDKDLILDCIKRGDLYESAYFHDCVFKGKDGQGKTQYAAVRSTSSGYKGDAEGSDKQCCFLLPPDDPDTREAAIFESPIDVLSHKSLCIHGFVPQFNGWRVSLGGTSLLGVEHFLKHRPHITYLYICTDADEAGEKAAAKIAELPVVTAVRSLPERGKDWNDMLQAMQKAERTRYKALTRAHERG